MSIASDRVLSIDRAGCSVLQFDRTGEVGAAYLALRRSLIIVVCYKRKRKMCLCEEISDGEGEDTTFYRNVGIRLPIGAAPYRKRTESSRVCFSMPYLFVSCLMTLQEA